MLSISRVANADYYLGGKDGSGCGVHADEHGPADYPLGAVANGEPPGEWLVLGANPLNLRGRITAEGPSGEKFRKLVNHLQHPDTGEQLGRAPIDNSLSAEEKIADRVRRWRRKHPHATAEDEAAFRVRTAGDQRTGVNGWDAAFSAPKSWSVLWAAFTWAGRHDDAEKLMLALEAGVRAAMEQLFEELAFTRHGPAGPKTNDTVTTDYRHARNLMSATFRHHVSRERDPNLHIHVMIVNRMLTESGAWHALYSGALLRSKVQLDATFARTAESEARRTLGLSFVRNPDTPWREIEGVSTDVRDYFSSRSRALSTEAEEDIQAYQNVYGRKPDARRRWQIRQRANLKTRRAKPKDAPSREEDIQRWEEETRQASVEHFADVLETVDEIVALAADDEIPEYDPKVVIAAAVADLEAQSSVFNHARLAHAISQRLPDQLDVDRALVDRLVEQAVESGAVISTAAKPVVEVPASMRDPRTGRSRFDAPDTRKFTTPGTLVMEDSLLARLDRRGARRGPAGTVNALLAQTTLSAEQMAVARGVLCSDRSLEIVNAPAGTGKSVTVKAISDVAEQVWGTGVTGFALSEVAASVLRREGVARAFNVARYLDYAQRAARGAVSDTERVTFAVPKGGVVVVDETSMLDTPQLTRLLTELDRAGVGKVVLVGDTAQLDAVDMGGGFSMLVGEVERREREALKALPTAEDFAAADMAAWTGDGQREREPQQVRRLSQVRRFTHGWEADASTALREGKVEALAQYEARGRVFGDPDHERVRDLAVRNFVIDWLSGRDSIIVTGSQEDADDLSSRVRQRLVEAGHVSRDGVRVRGHNFAGVGDVVQSRVNDHDEAVFNRDRWQVVGTSEAGELHVRKSLGGGVYADEVQVLEPHYVKRAVELSYAGTVHAAQGLTIHGSAHNLVGRMTSASHAYVGGTRGTERNIFYTELEQDETPVGRLAAVFGSDTRTKAAHVEMADEQLRQKSLGHLFVLWETIVRETRAATHRDMLVRELGDDAPAVLSDPVSNRLFGLLRQAELTGHDPHGLVASVMGKRTVSLAGAESPASALYAQVHDEMKVAGLGAPTPTTFESRVPRPSRGEVENENLDKARRIGRALDDRTAELAREAADEAQEWAVRACGPVPKDEAERAAWIGRVAHAAALREAQGYTDPRDAIGRRPTHVEPEKSWLWDLAARDIGIPEHERDLQGRPDGELVLRVAAWKRAQSSAPRYVDGDLLETHLAVQELERRVVDARTRGEDTAELVAERDRFVVRAGKLEEIAGHRRDWLEAHRESQALAEEAQRELDRRGEVERARAGVPLPREPEDDEPEVESEAEREEREAREAEDREAAAHAAVFDLLSAHRVPDAPEYGTAEWLALEPDDPRREAAVVQAAAAWWNLGEPRDAEVAEMQARLESAAEVIGVPATSPEIDEDTLAVLAWQDPHLQGDAPQFGSPDWAELEPEDPRREAATVRAAAAYWRLGDTPERLRERTEAAEDRATSIEISRDLERQRVEAHRERVQRETEERQAEEQRQRDLERRPVEVTAQERAVDGVAAAELDYRDPQVPDTDREVARLYLESQGVQPEPEEPEPRDEPVVWPEPAPIPDPEVETESPGHTQSGPDSREDPEHEEQGEYEATLPDPEPQPEDNKPTDADVVEPIDQTWGPNVGLLPDPEPEPEPDEERFQAGLAFSLEQAARQREADERAEAERVERENAQRDEPDPEPDPEPRDEQADRDAQIESDLAHAREAAARLEAQREADERAADEAARWEPEPEPEPEVELVD